MAGWGGGFHLFGWTVKGWHVAGYSPHLTRDSHLRLLYGSSCPSTSASYPPLIRLLSTSCSSTSASRNCRGGQVWDESLFGCWGGRGQVGEDRLLEGTGLYGASQIRLVTLDGR